MADFEHWVDPESIERIASEDRACETKFRRLVDSGAPDLCYAVSHSPELDGSVLKLPDALGFLDTHQVYGTILCCVPGAIAYYEHTEAVDLTWILRSRASPRETSRVKPVHRRRSN